MRGGAHGSSPLRSALTSWVGSCTCLVHKWIAGIMKGGPGLPTRLLLVRRLLECGFNSVGWFMSLWSPAHLESIVTI